MVTQDSTTQLFPLRPTEKPCSPLSGSSHLKGRRPRVQIHSRSSRAAGAETSCSLPFEARLANPDPATFLHLPRICTTRGSQEPASLTRPQATENDVSALTHTQEGRSGPTDDYISMVPPLPHQVPSQSGSSAPIQLPQI